jgi:hypothetical protein
MDHILKPANRIGRKPFFGDLSPIVGPLLMLLLGLGSVTVFYASVFAAAHAVAADGGLSGEQFEVVSLWVCALLIVQGLVPIVRFSLNELPRLAIGRLKIGNGDAAMYVLLFVAGAFLLFG